MTHTPGPWKINHKWPSEICAGTKCITIIDCYADACLIASAPELLAALEDAISQCQLCHGAGKQHIANPYSGSVSYKVCGLCKPWRDVVKKAKGE